MIKTDFYDKLQNLSKNEFNIPSRKAKAMLINKRFDKQIPTKTYITYFSGITLIDSWKSNGMSAENIENITKSDSDFEPTFVDHHILPEINFTFL